MVRSDIGKTIKYIVWYEVLIVNTKLRIVGTVNKFITLADKRLLVVYIITFHYKRACNLTGKCIS